MEPLQTLDNRARAHPQRIVLVEGEDERVLRAAAQAVAKKVAKPTLLGRASAIQSLAARLGLALDGIEIIDPASSPRLEPYAQLYFERRRARGTTLEESYAAARKPACFAALRVALADADGVVSCPSGSPADAIRASLHSIGLAPDARILSSFSIVIAPPGVTSSAHTNAALLFADCGVVANPSAQDLADIAIQSANSARTLLEIEPRFALLSFSTKGSASHPSLEKIREALRTVQVRNPALAIDGELQADVALLDSVAAVQAPGSPVAGRADILIFPDLNSADIASKLVEQLAGATVLGPILQGLSHPASIVSRTSSPDDITNVIAVTAIQSIARKQTLSASG